MNPLKVICRARNTTEANGKLFTLVTSVIAERPPVDGYIDGAHRKVVDRRMQILNWRNKLFVLFHCTLSRQPVSREYVCRSTSEAIRQWRGICSFLCGRRVSIIYAMCRR